MNEATTIFRKPRDRKKKTTDSIEKRGRRRRGACTKTKPQQGKPGNGSPINQKTLMAGGIRKRKNPTGGSGETRSRAQSRSKMQKETVCPSESGRRKEENCGPIHQKTKGEGKQKARRWGKKMQRRKDKTLVGGHSKLGGGAK